MDIDRQIEFWKSGGQEDMAAARSLLEKGHARHAMFFAHLALEKALKAAFIRTRHELPPRIHDLLRLAELANLAPSTEQRMVLGRIQQYCLAGRYPDAQPIRLTVEEAVIKLKPAQEVFTWLQNLLK